MNILKQISKAGAFVMSVMAINSIITTPVYAHARWVIPSHTVVSGDKPMAISLDYSISNDIFHPDIALGGKSLAGSDQNTEHSANPMMAIMAKTQASVVSPKGVTKKLESVNLGRKTSTYFTADNAGTYRVDIEQPPIDVTLYKTEQGDSQRLFGTYKEVKEKIPKGASAIESMQFINRVQTFVTYNNTNTQNLAPTGKGLELTHSTHPNELFAKEKTTHQLLFDGKPIIGDKNNHIKITKAGMRFRNQRESLEPKLSNTAEFEVIWPEAGFYLVEIEYEIQQKKQKVVNTLFLTIEIHPE